VGIAIKPSTVKNLKSISFVTASLGQTLFYSYYSYYAAEEYGSLAAFGSSHASTKNQANQLLSQ
jgi:hypothetical protein